MNKIAAFFGADHKCGTTTLCRSAGETLLRKAPQANILLVYGDAGWGESCAPAPALTLGSLRPYMAGGLLDFPEIVRKAKTESGLSIIGSTDDPAMCDSYTPEMAAVLLKGLTEYYDLILCDCGSDMSRGFAFGVLLNAAAVCLVLNQTESCFCRSLWMWPLFAKLDIQPDFCVVNRFSRASLYGRDYAAKRLEIDPAKLFTVRTSRFGDSAETDGRSLLQYGDRAFRRDTEKLSVKVAERTNNGIIQLF